MGVQYVSLGSMIRHDFAFASTLGLDARVSIGGYGKGCSLSINREPVLSGMLTLVQATLIIIVQYVL